MSSWAPPSFSPCAPLHHHYFQISTPFLRLSRWSPPPVASASWSAHLSPTSSQSRCDSCGYWGYCCTAEVPLSRILHSTDSSPPTVPEGPSDCSRSAESQVYSWRGPRGEVRASWISFRWGLCRFQLFRVVGGRAGGGREWSLTSWCGCMEQSGSWGMQSHWS